MLKKSLILLIIVILVASFFRLWILKSVPGGLFPDEAANGLDILSIFKGQHSVFFERGLGREALFFYLQAISVALFGIGVWQMHLISAIIGILSVIALWFLAKKLFNTRVAFLASFFMATSAWHVTHSRTGFRAILVPLFSTLFFYFAYSIFKEGVRKKRLIFAILAGICLALGFYTYPSFRMIVPIIGALFIVILIINREVLKKYWLEITMGFLIMLLILTPLLVYFVHHPWDFAGRVGYVSIFNKDQNQGDLIGTFLQVAKKTFLMFFTAGDLNWRHNVSGYSMLNPWISLFFALGILYSILIIVLNFFKKTFFKKDCLGNWFIYFFMIMWFFGMLAPELLTVESIPHGLRAIGVIPVAFLFAAMAIDIFLRKFESSLKSRSLSLLIILYLSLILITNLLYDYRLYFGISANSPEFYYAYRSDLTVVSDYLNQRNDKEKTYLVLDKYSVQTPEFLTAKYNQPYILVDPANSYQTILNPEDQIVFTQSTIFDSKKFEEYHNEATIKTQEYNRFGQEIMRVYEY
jgi:4-amino-4-deoxy-L-arabinose transferase-like glycosyltransferase